MAGYLQPVYGHIWLAVRFLAFVWYVHMFHYLCSFVDMQYFTQCIVMQPADTVSHSSYLADVLISMYPFSGADTDVQSTHYSPSKRPHARDVIQEPD